MLWALSGFVDRHGAPVEVQDDFYQDNTVEVFVVFIGPRCTWGPIYGSRPLSQTERRFADSTDVTLAGKDTNSILTDNANRAFQCNVVMKVTKPGGQLWNQYRRCHPRC